MTGAQTALVVVALLTAVSALGAAVVGGVFFAFSGFVMRGLGQVSPAAGLEAMQAINVTAVRPPLMITLFGTVLTGLAACVLLAVNDAGHALWWGFAGEVVYLAAVIVLTVGFHVPRNNRIATLDPREPASVAEWSRYLAEWTRGNHVRAAGGVVASVLFGIATVLTATAIGW
ncbi:anthrone oxygenase family protein [Herbiconiux sp.]|uniref:anthrone oxygenase family protein n=1 Tax=Herbiconiux sp. TaxID=1871186 RepID=UPI0025BA9829|nr:anthrone oxygenase family protein [Herbiconiux sp.]